MDRVRQAGWLVAIPPIGLGLELLRNLDIDMVLARSFLTSQFAFWTENVPSDVQTRVFLNLVLFLAAAAVSSIAVVAGRARTAVILVSAAQAFVALPGLVWNLFDRTAPDLIARSVPVPGGRWTSFFYLVFALIALGLASSAASRR